MKPPGAGTAGSCEVCERHAESMYRIEGMDCHDEVALLERRLEARARLRGADRRRRQPAAVRPVRRGACHVGRIWSPPSARPACAPGSSTSVPTRRWRAPAGRRLRFVVASGIALAAGLALEHAQALADGRAAGVPCGHRLRQRPDAAAARSGGARVLARHQRADADRRRRGHRDRPVVRGGHRHVPVRAGAAARDAQHGARAPRDPRADGPRAGRGAGADATGRSSRSGSTTCRSARRSSSGPASKIPLDGVIVAGSEPDQPGADHRRVAAGGQGPGRRGVRRHDQRHRRARGPRHPRRARHDAGAASSAWSRRRRPSARRRRPSSSGSPAYYTPAVIALAAAVAVVPPRRCSASRSRRGSTARSCCW